MNTKYQLVNPLAWVWGYNGCHEYLKEMDLLERSLEKLFSTRHHVETFHFLTQTKLR